MAESFDPLRNTASRAAEILYTQVQKNQSNTDANLSHPSNDTVLKSQGSIDVNYLINSSGEQQSRTSSNKKVSFIDNATKASIPSTKTNDTKVRNSSSPSDLINQPSQVPKSEQCPIHIIEPKTKPYWETEQDSFEEWNQGQSSGWNQGRSSGWNQGQSEEYYDEGYEPGQASGYNDEYKNDQKPRKKKGVSAKIDRLVTRFPALGVFYKTPPSSPDTNKSEQRFQYAETPDLTHAYQSAHVLSPEDLALNERYSNKLHIKSINLPAKDETQAVDLRIHHETNRIYLCDVGRSIIDIFDINGKLQHTIDGPFITKFKPTAIAVAFDGAIIVASYFSHCLHMYSPVDSQTGNSTDGKASYQYKQYKLGVPGEQIHQFQFPAGISVDNSDGYLYICDRGNYRIQVMRPEGICERLIELVVKNKKKQILDPVRIAHQQNHEQIVCIVGTGDAICFLSKYANGRTSVEPVYVVDENGIGLESAAGLAVDVHDRIFISDTGHHRIVICTPDGEYITSIGMEGNEPGQLKRPCGLDVTSDGTIVVTDAGNKRIQLFGSVHEQVLDENNPPQETPDGSNNLSTETTRASLISM